ncbi:VOC family protein [Sphaerisporangium sp. B11E5]|uniref:VOC family protein n=1 Tax=Sphaerisporangium sp. B11E5 TaxID=3153563 RepID=UPI00325E77EC
MITHIGTVDVFVRDQDAAVEFYVGKLGFDLRRDESMGPMRWIEVAPPGAQTTIVIATADWPVGSEDKIGIFTDIQLITDDIKADYDRLKAAGVTFTTEPEDQSWAWHSAFVDPDGNEFFLIQPKS